MLHQDKTLLGEKIIAVARGWIGTKFYIQGRVKKTELFHGACDCLGLIVGVAKELELKSKILKYFHEFDQNNYSQFSNHEELPVKLGILLHEKFDKNLGDILLFKTGRKTFHAAISSHNDMIIHSSFEQGGVVEQNMTNRLKKQLHSIFSF